MGALFNLENPVWNFMGKVADLVILNLLALICSIPIVTIGASWTAMYYVTIKIVRKEEGYIIRDFFRSFKENFKQATIIWLLTTLPSAKWTVCSALFRKLLLLLPTAKIPIRLKKAPRPAAAAVQPAVAAAKSICNYF